MKKLRLRPRVVTRNATLKENTEHDSYRVTYLHNENRMQMSSVYVCANYYSSIHQAQTNSERNDETCRWLNEENMPRTLKTCWRLEIERASACVRSKPTCYSATIRHFPT